MSFKATLRSPDTFAKVISVFKDLVDIVVLDVSKQGFSVVTVDTAHVFLIDFALFSENAFTKFECSEIPVSVGLQLTSMHQIFKKIGADDVVTLLVDDKEDDSHIYITVRSGSIGSKTIKYKVGQMIITNRDRVEIPERDYPCEVMLPSNALTKICTEMQNLGDTVTIRFENNFVQFDVSTELIECQIKLESQDSIKILCKNPQSLMFKFAFFCKMAKAAKINNSQEVLLQMGMGLPLSLCFQLGNEGSLNFYLAPLIEE